MKKKVLKNKTPKNLLLAFKRKAAQLAEATKEDSWAGSYEPDLARLVEDNLKETEASFNAIYTLCVKERDSMRRENAELLRRVKRLERQS